MSKSVKNNQSGTFRDYLSLQQPEFRQCLSNLYRLVKSIVPDAEESLSYQVHCFKDIYMLVGIGVNKKFCSLYTMSPALVKQMKDDLAECRVSGATLHFKTEEPLPADIITKIVLARKKENEIRALSKKIAK